VENLKRTKRISIFDRSEKGSTGVMVVESTEVHEKEKFQLSHCDNQKKEREVKMSFLGRIDEMKREKESKSQFLGVSMK
jgi:hypothetical protein